MTIKELQDLFNRLLREKKITPDFKVIFEYDSGLEDDLDYEIDGNILVILEG